MIWCAVLENSTERFWPGNVIIDSAWMMSGAEARKIMQVPCFLNPNQTSVEIRVSVFDIAIFYIAHYIHILVMHWEITRACFCAWCWNRWGSHEWKYLCNLTF